MYVVRRSVFEPGSHFRPFLIGRTFPSTRTTRPFRRVLLTAVAFREP